MRNFLFPVLLAFLLLPACKQGPVKLVSVPDKWKGGQSQKIILQGVRQARINAIGFWIDTIIRGGARPSDTIRIPALSGLKPGRHTLYLDFFRQGQHIQRITKDFIWIPAPASDSLNRYK